MDQAERRAGQVYRTEDGKTLTLASYEAQLNAWRVEEYAYSVYSEDFLRSCTFIAGSRLPVQAEALDAAPASAPNHLVSTDPVTGERTFTPTVASKAPLNGGTYSNMYAPLSPITVESMQKAIDDMYKTAEIVRVPAAYRYGVDWGQQVTPFYGPGIADMLNQPQKLPYCVSALDNEQRVYEAMVAQDARAAKPVETGNTRELAQSHVHPRGCLGMWSLREVKP